MSGDDVRILFMGTPEIAAATLNALAAHDGVRVIGAVTQPDRKKGRGMRFVPSEVKTLATELGIPVFQPETLKDGAFAETLSSLDPDLIIVTAYGKILPPYIIDYPRFGCVNAHASILPKYRGAAPINRAVMDGERETGVTAMYMDEGLDTGDIILTLTTPIGDDDTAGTVHDRLAVLAGDAMCRVADMTRAGCVPRTPQPAEGATYAAKITKEDCFIDFTKTAREVRDLIRGLSPFPGAVTTLPSGRLLKVTRASIFQERKGVPGEVVGTDGAIRVACADGSVDFTEVIPEGKGRMDAASFVRGRGVSAGDVLGA
ncbi:MAG: methionyl-tRNA formyltransferase [Clostridia bacterium]|nr:methionyl-tRNA formyltransferase [Clostridia bacterium]MBR7033692.1 methionyl-tRNA formyltransferase [Clostridia bacterium]